MTVVAHSEGAGRVRPAAKVTGLPRPAQESLALVEQPASTAVTASIPQTDAVIAVTALEKAEGRLVIAPIASDPVQYGAGECDDLVLGVATEERVQRDHAHLPAFGSRCHQRLGPGAGRGEARIRVVGGVADAGNAVQRAGVSPDGQGGRLIGGAG